ncbi:MAG: helix-turn-helix domain-containing protein [Anaerolineales bacterium]|nr:helix-turn-helix domain-containing protein [Anaerolineales bacterium]
MAQYRIAGLDLSTRMQITVEMVLSAHERGWGRASQLAQDYGVSRTLLYEWRHKAMQSLQETLQPHDPGPCPLKQSLDISSSFIQRAMALWPMLTGSA